MMDFYSIVPMKFTNNNSLSSTQQSQMMEISGMIEMCLNPASSNVMLDDSFMKMMCTKICMVKDNYPNKPFIFFKENLCDAKDEKCKTNVCDSMIASWE